ncbi:MAG: helix-turn-helix transcriptional regulator [Pseudomonadota bacterium]
MEDTVTISRAEYDALNEARETLSDQAAYDLAIARLAAGEDELMPAEYVYRMVDGEPPLRVFREWRGLSQNALAKKSGVNRVQIGDIEDRGKTGSVATLKKLAEALGITIDDLV